MHILNRTYTAQDVSEVTDIPSKSIANWADRGLIVPINSDDLGRGRAREYSWNTLMQIVCAAAIMELGFTSPKDALTAAMRFALIGKGPSYWVGEPATDQAVRLPGLPFHHMRGITMLYTAKDEGAVLLHRIWNNELFADGYFSLREQLRGVRAHIALDMTGIFKSVCERLGEDYRLVMDDAYRGQDEAVNWKQPGQGG